MTPIQTMGIGFARGCWIARLRLTEIDRGNLPHRDNDQKHHSPRSVLHSWRK